jgi:hypothetical protein
VIALLLRLRVARASSMGMLPRLPLNFSGYRAVFQDDDHKVGRWPRGPGEEAAIMKRGLLVGLGALIVLVGAIFTLQGLGAIGGSAMSGDTFWAVAGPVIALVGLAMAAIGLRRRSAS